MLLENKVTIITGAAGGIGESLCNVFAREGAPVFMVDINEENGKKIEARLKDQGYKAWFCKADVSSADDTDNVFKKIAQFYDHIDVLINNAAMAYKATIAELTEEQWDKQIGVNMKSVYLYSHRVIPIMAKIGGGCIINTGSVTSLVGVPDYAAYVGSKTGMLGLTRAMALDHIGQGIRVNIICPSGVKTPLMDWQFSTAPDPQQEIDRVLSLHPIGRMAHPDEVAEFCVFLASEKGSYFTGTAFPFDGGYTAR